MIAEVAHDVAAPAMYPLVSNSLECSNRSPFRCPPPEAVAVPAIQRPADGRACPASFWRPAVRDGWEGSRGRALAAHSAWPPPPRRRTRPGEKKSRGEKNPSLRAGGAQVAAQHAAAVREKTPNPKPCGRGGAGGCATRGRSGRAARGCRATSLCPTRCGCRTWWGWRSISRRSLSAPPKPPAAPLPIRNAARLRTPQSINPAYIMCSL